MLECEFNPLVARPLLGWAGTVKAGSRTSESSCHIHQLLPGHPIHRYQPPVRVTPASHRLCHHHHQPGPQKSLEGMVTVEPGGPSKGCSVGPRSGSALALLLPHTLAQLAVSQFLLVCPSADSHSCWINSAAPTLKLTLPFCVLPTCFTLGLPVLLNTKAFPPLSCVLSAIPYLCL